MTIEELMSHGTGLMEAYWSHQPPERKIKGLSEDFLLKHISEEKRLEGISEETLRKYLEKKFKH